MTTREEVVRIALAEEGEQDPDRYWRETCPAFLGTSKAHAGLSRTTSWCGGFALWCLRQAGLCSWEWIPRRGFIWHNGEQRLPSVERPEPGDVAYFDRYGQHYAIVAGVDGELVTLINGNGMRAPLEGVTVTTRPLVDGHYFSIAPLLAGDPGDAADVRA